MADSSAAAHSAAAAHAARQPAGSLRQRLRRHVLPLLAWTLIWALFFGTLLLGRERLPSGDFAGQFHAYALFQAEELLSGRFPLWLPGSHAGTPFAADTQAAAFYPPRYLTILFSAPWDLPLYALQLEALLHVWLAGLFTYLLAFDLARRRDAALLAAVAFGLGGYLTSFPLPQLAVLESITWLPLVLWLLRRGVRGHRPVPWLVAAGLALAMSALAGHPQTLLHVGYVAAAYYLFLAIRARWAWRWVFGLGMLAAGMAVGAAMAALLPAGVLAANSTRSDVTYAFVSGGAPLQDFLQLVLPGVLSAWVPQFVGVVVFLLAVFALFARREAARGAAQEAGKDGRAEILFWAVLALLAGWLALGDAGILFAAAYRLLPGFAFFRQQERLLGVANLSLALLAAQGLALWWRMNGTARRQAWRKAAIATGLLLLLGAVYMLADPAQADMPWPAVWLRQVVFFVLAVGLLSGRVPGKWRRGVGPALILLLVVDLYAGTAGSINRQPGTPNAYWPEPDWLASLRNDLAAEPLARIDSRNLFHANLGPIYGLEDVHGISPLKLRKLAQFQQIPITTRWQLLGVRYLLDYAAPHPAAEPVGEIMASVYPDREIYAQGFRYDGALPRAWLSYRPRLVADEAAARVALEDPAFDPAGQVILHKPPAGVETIAPPDTPPDVQVQRLDPRTLQIDVQTETAGFLVISEWDYPGWRATIDGAPAELVPADFALQGVLVPAGTHTVVLRFQPWDVPLGAGISLLTLVVGLGLAWRWRPVVALRAARAASRQPLDAVGAGSPEVGNLFAVAQTITTHWQLLLLGLTLLGFGLRMHNLGVQELRGDEGYSYPFTQIPFSQVLPTLAPVGEEHAPLHYLLLNAWTSAAGDSEFNMRIPAVIPGLLFIPLAFVLGRRVNGAGLGLFLAAIATVSQSLVWLGQDVRNQYVAAVFFGTLATLLLDRAVHRPGWWRWALYSLACALTMYSHYYGLFALAAGFFYLLALPGNLARRKASLAENPVQKTKLILAWALSAMAAALMFAPWFLATFQGWVGQLDEPANPQLADYLSTIGRELVVGPAFAHPAGRWLFLLSLGLCVWGAVTLWRQRREWAALLVGWLFLGTLGVFVILLNRDIFNNYYIAPVAPTWWALVGMGLVALWGRRGRWGPWLAIGMVVVFVLAAGRSLAQYYGDPVQYGRTRGNRALIEYVAGQAEPGDLFVANFPDPALNYYLHRLEMPQTTQPVESPLPAEAIETELAGLAAEYERLWFVPEFGALWDAEDVAERWLDYHMLVEEKRTFTNLELHAYRPAHAVAEVVAPINETLLDGAVQLVGAYMTVDGIPADLLTTTMIPAGAEVAVTLVWDVHRPVAQDFTVFVHLLGADGSLVAQHDGVPLFGTRPASTWQVGERLLDRHEFTVPETVAVPAGQLVTGLYRPDTLTRLPFADGSTALWLAGVIFSLAE